jgi:predicted GNAT family N-acyltransferase
MIITEVPYSDVLQLRQTVMYPNHNIDFVKLPDDDKGLHIGVYEYEELISAMSVFLKDRAIQFRKLATRTDKQGAGGASALMEWLIDYANDMKFEKIWCNARVEVTGFYKRFGYQETGTSFRKNGYDYIVMEKIL